MICDGQFEVIYDEAKERPTVAPALSECGSEAEFRITYLNDMGLEPVNTCEKCTCKASVLSMTYSVVRLEKNK